MENAYVTTLDNHDDFRLPIDNVASLRSDWGGRIDRNRWKRSTGLGGNVPPDWEETFTGIRKIGLKKSFVAIMLLLSSVLVI